MDVVMVVFIPVHQHIKIGLKVLLVHFQLVSNNKLFFMKQKKKNFEIYSFLFTKTFFRKYIFEYKEKLLEKIHKCPKFQSPI
jgi:hypothetical protein